MPFCRFNYAAFPIDNIKKGLCKKLFAVFVPACYSGGAGGDYMKKILSLLIVLAAFFSLSACSGGIKWGEAKVYINEFLMR